MLHDKFGVDDRVRQKFTGYQKDEETNLDFAEARMYQNLHGRFTAIDPLLASGKSANPQTFNRYVYVMNNPLLFVDPDGLQAATAVWVRGPEGHRNFVTTRGERPRGSGWKRFSGTEDVRSTDGSVQRVSSSGFVGVGWHGSNPIPSQGISTSVTPTESGSGLNASGQALVDDLGARGPGAMQFLGALMGGAVIGGLAAVPAAGAGGAVFAGTIVGEALLAEQAIRQNAEAGHEAAMIANTNPFKGPVDQPVTIVDDSGNAIRVDATQQVTGSPDGQYIQVRDQNGQVTGVRKDGPHKDHAKFPHAHVPGISNPDGTEQLPIRTKIRIR